MVPALELAWASCDAVPPFCYSAVAHAIWWQIGRRRSSEIWGEAFHIADVGEDREE